MGSEMCIRDSQSGLLGYDPARATAALDAAGWRPGPDGVRAKNGQRLPAPLNFAQNIATTKSALELVHQQLRRIGVDLQLVERQISETAVIQQKGDFVALWANLTRADPDILRSSYWSGGNNFYRFPAGGPLDDALIAQAAAVDPAERTRQAGEAQRLLAAGHHQIPVVELTTVLGVGPTAHDVAFDASSRIQLHDTWKSE